MNLRRGGGKGDIVSVIKVVVARIPQTTPELEPKCQACPIMIMQNGSALAVAPSPPQPNLPCQQSHASCG